MKPKTIHISIPIPCHERWADMNATETGAFCRSCQTEVVDFSAMTDSEVIAYLSKHKTACGRFHKDQVERKLILTQVKNGLLKWKALLLAVLSLGSMRAALAAAPAKSAMTRIDQAQIGVPRDTVKPLPCMITIHGKVLNESGENMPDAFVRLIDSAGYDSTPQIRSDSLGNFTMEIKEDSIKSYPLRIKVSHWHHRSKALVLTEETEQRVVVKLDEQVEVIMGKMRMR